MVSPIKVDIMFLVNYFLKVGEGLLHFSLFIIFLYTKRSSDERACDAKAPTPYESETDHHVWQGNCLERLRILNCDGCARKQCIDKANDPNFAKSFFHK